jgi:hypothetical protein
MDHVRRRLSSSRNNVSNMRLDGAMGTPLQVQVNGLHLETLETEICLNFVTLGKALAGGR